MRKLAFATVWLLVFVTPWENMMLVSGGGTITREIGVLAFIMALLAVSKTIRWRSV